MEKIFLINELVESYILFLYVHEATFAEQYNHL